MDTPIRIAAIVIGALGLFVYFRSIVQVMLLNRRERDLIERFARCVAVGIIHGLAGRNNRERWQAWTLPVFIFVAVTTWFLLVQFSFSFILWAFHTEANWPKAFSSSGSALSTLGYLTPSSLLGEYLATYEAAIGLAIVILLFTFVPGYQAAIQARERRVGWLNSRTGQHPTGISVLASIKNAGKLDDPEVWEGWEDWFRGILETHSISPILAFSPSVYKGTNWVCASSAVLDAASLMLAILDSKATDAARICRDSGVTTLALVAGEIHGNVPDDAWSRQHVDSTVIANFDHLYDRVIELGLPVKGDKATCREMFITLRSEYDASLRHIAKSTLMPIEQA